MLEVSSLGFQIKRNAINLLKTHQNEPAEAHEQSLEKVGIQISLMLHDKEFGKFAVPLETGMGKTTCIIATLQALQATNFSALICIESIEQGQELYEECLNRGIEKHRIDRFHKTATKYEDYPSVSQEAASQYQFLIVCHNKMYSDGKKIGEPNEISPIAWMNSYNGRERSIVFWDERLEAKCCFTLFRSDVRSALGAWIPLYEEKLRSLALDRLSTKHRNIIKTTAEWVNDANAALATSEKDLVLALPELDLSIREAKNALEYINSREGSDAINGYILELMKYSQIGQVRLMQAGNESALIQFQAQIHSGFNKLMIFDATMPIRELSKYDKSVKIMDLPIRKSYKNVTINVCEAYSSKEFLTKSKTCKRNLESYYREIDLLLANYIPRRESLLIITFKGICDVVQKHFDQPKYDGRIKVIHWGGHKASNKHVNFKYIVALGLLRRNPHDLVANILGARNDIGSEIKRQELLSVEHTEMADTLLQGIGRGYNRVIKAGGIAGETTVWVYLPRKDHPVIEALKKAMSGVVIKERNSGKHFERERSRRSKSQLIAEQIDEKLSEFDLNYLTINTLRSMFNPKVDSQDKAWQRGLGYFLKTNSEHWTKRGKLLVATPTAIDLTKDSSQH